MKKFVSVLGVAVCLTSSLCHAGPPEMTTADLREMIPSLQDAHQIKLLSVDINGRKQFVLLQAKLNSRTAETSSARSIAAGVVSAGILYASYKNAFGIYEGVKQIRAVQQMGFFIVGGTKKAYLQFAMASFVTAAAVYAGVSLAKEAVKPYFGNNFYFREFNHWTSFTGDHVVKLAKGIDKDASQSAAASPNFVNVEYVDLEYMEGVTEILKSSLYGYRVESVSSLSIR